MCARGRQGIPWFTYCPTLYGRAYPIERLRSCRLTACGCAIVTQIGNPVRVFANGHIQSLGNVIDQHTKEMDVLDINIGILHANNACSRDVED